MPPFQEGQDSLFFETFNRNKKSVSLDLRQPEGARGLPRPRPQRRRRLLEPARRPARPARPDLRVAAARQPGDRLLLAVGLRDDRPTRRARAATTTSCRASPAGWMLTGEPDAPPTKTGLSLVDLSGGYVAAIALLAGLWQARRDGVGCDCDVSLFETALAELMYVGTWAATPRLRAAAPAELRASVARAVPELPHGRRLDRRRLREGEVLGAALRRDRAAGAERRTSASRRGPRATSTATSCCRSSTRPSATRPVDDWVESLVAPASPRRASTPSRRRSPTRRRSRGEDVVEHDHPTLGRGAVDPHAAAVVQDGERSSAPARGPFRGSTPRSCCRALRLQPRARSRARRRRRLRERGAREPRSRRLRAAPARPALAGRRPDSRVSFVLNYEEGGENTPLEGDPASEAFLHEVVGAPPTVGPPQPEHGVDVRVRQPHRLLARASHLHARTACR